MICGLTVIGAAAFLQTLVLLVLLPSRKARIMSCLLFARVVGYSCAWLAGCKLTMKGEEHLDSGRPAIYLVNHSSIVDLFIVCRLVPSTAVGIAKKEIVRYPFFGQMYLLTGHLRIDRGRHEAAIASTSRLARFVRKAGLSIIMAPEGTRARDGRLQPFKKGFVHLALQTGLPIVPIVVRGAHQLWQKGDYSVRGGKVSVDILAPMDTSHWSADETDLAVEEVHSVYREHLPAEQLPVP